MSTTTIYKKTIPEVKDANGVVTPAVDSYYNDNQCTIENSEYADLEEKTGYTVNNCPQAGGRRRRSKKSLAKKSKKAKKTKKSKKSRKTKKSRKH